MKIKLDMFINKKIEDKVIAKKKIEDKVITKKKDLFLSLIAAIKLSDEFKVSEITNKVPRDKIGDFIWKLGRYKYKTMKMTQVATSQLKWRRGF